MKFLAYRDFYPGYMRYVRSCRSPEARDIQRHGIRRTSGARLSAPPAAPKANVIRPKSAPPTNIRHRERGRPSDPVSCDSSGLVRTIHGAKSQFDLRGSRSIEQPQPSRDGWVFRFGDRVAGKRSSNHPDRLHGKGRNRSGFVTPRKSPPAIAAGCRPPRAPCSSARPRPPCACRTPRASNRARPRRPWSSAPAPPLRSGFR